MMRKLNFLKALTILILLFSIMVPYNLTDSSNLQRWRPHIPPRSW
jgi:hypothetical protein